MKRGSAPSERGEHATKNVKAELCRQTLPNFVGWSESNLSAEEREIQREQNAIHETVKSVFPDDDTMKVEIIWTFR